MTETEHYKSIVAYDGTNFRGFQRQAESERTVQGVLETALAELGWQGSSLRAAGRTDSGVHARGQVVSFFLEWKSSPDKLTAALNAHLQDDVAVRHTETVPEDFDPRFSAVRRRYIYSLLVDPAPDPLRERTAWRVWPAPDTERMREAASAFIGTRDFGAFGQAPKPDGHTVRSISRSELESAGSELRLILEADAFLYRMVRRITGALLQIGKGDRQQADIESSLSNPTQKWVGKLAPAKGLCLEAVIYEAEGS